jgi:Trehalase
MPLAVVRNFLALQQANGFIPRTISPKHIWDASDLCKPFLCQTLLHEMERTNWAGLDQISPMLDKLALHLDYFRSHRFNQTFGLYFWLNVLESGVDDNYALLAPHEAAKTEDQSRVGYPDGRLLASDLNAYLVAEMRALSRLAGRCGREDYERKFADQAIALVSRIEQVLWNDVLGMYVNIDPVDGKPVKLRSWTGLAPVLFCVSSEERVQRVLKENVLNERHFLRPYGIASMAASENLSNQAPRGLYGRAIVCNWNGPVWILPNVLVVRTLLKYGLHKQARDIARRVLAAMAKDLKETGVLHENYDANTGTSLWAPRFMSWNIMALELIDLVVSNRRSS